MQIPQKGLVIEHVVRHIVRKALPKLYMYGRRTDRVFAFRNTHETLRTSKLYIHACTRNRCVSIHMHRQLWRCCAIGGTDANESPLRPRESMWKEEEEEMGGFIR